MRDAAEMLNPPADGDRVFLPDRCANCLTWLPEDVAGLFCSDWCQEACKHVRYFRRKLHDGQLHDPDVQAAISIRLAFLPTGGYTALGRTLSPTVRAAVIDRADGKCEFCGKPGVDVDHIAGSSSDLSNLQLLCTDCHHTKTDASLVPASETTRALIDTFITGRVLVEEPRLLADDEESWAAAWPALKRERKQRLLNDLSAVGIVPEKSATRHDLIELRDDALTDDDGFEPEDYDGGYGEGSYFARAMNKDD